MTTPITTTLRALTADTETLLSARLRPLGLTVPQLEFLAVFAADPDACGADASRACHVTPQTGTTVISSLTRKGLIRAESVPGTGRRHTVTVTAAGRQVLDEAHEAIADVTERLGTLLGPQAAVRLRNVSDAFGAQIAAGRKQPALRPKTTARAAKTSPKKKAGRSAAKKKRTPPSR